MAKKTIIVGQEQLSNQWFKVVDCWSRTALKSVVQSCRLLVKNSSQISGSKL